MLVGGVRGPGGAGPGSRGPGSPDLHPCLRKCAGTVASLIAGPGMMNSTFSPVQMGDCKGLENISTRDLNIGGGGQIVGAMQRALSVLGVDTPTHTEL